MRNSGGIQSAAGMREVLIAGSGPSSSSNPNSANSCQLTIHLEHYWVEVELDWDLEFYELSLDGCWKRCSATAILAAVVL